MRKRFLKYILTSIAALVIGGACTRIPLYEMTTNVKLNLKLKLDIDLDLDLSVETELDEE